MKDLEREKANKGPEKKKLQNCKSNKDFYCQLKTPSNDYR